MPVCVLSIRILNTIKKNSIAVGCRSRARPAPRSFPAGPPPLSSAEVVPAPLSARGGPTALPQ